MALLEIASFVLENNQVLLFPGFSFIITGSKEQ